MCTQTCIFNFLFHCQYMINWGWNDGIRLRIINLISKMPPFSFSGTVFFVCRLVVCSGSARRWVRARFNGKEKRATECDNPSTALVLYISSWYYFNFTYNDCVDTLLIYSIAFKCEQWLTTKTSLCRYTITLSFHQCNTHTYTLRTPESPHQLCACVCCCLKNLRFFFYRIVFLPRQLEIIILILSKSQLYGKCTGRLSCPGSMAVDNDVFLRMMMVMPTTTMVTAMMMAVHYTHPLQMTSCW